MSESKWREFNAVGLLRDYKNSSPDDYTEMFYNPRLRLTEMGRVEDLEKQLLLARQFLEQIRGDHCGCWDSCRCGGDSKNKTAKKAIEEIWGEK